MTNANPCPHCGGDDTLYNESRGETYCTSCGLVLEENCIIESVSFTETANGVIKSIGQFVPTNGFTVSSGSCETIRELTLQKGYTNIQRISNRLKLSLDLVEAAQRIYLMGVQRGFTSGRMNQHVAAACLYISCRRERTPYMLIDFSDVLMTPVKVLGRMFVKMLRTLRIDVPTIDPSLFMERFVAQMNVKDKAHEVAQTGVRLVQAMTRDWIATGRRPTGLCGAALLIAARYHGFKINPCEISSIIRLASSTIRKRLLEFRKTSTAQLKHSDFETTDLLTLPVITQPPCLMSKQRKTTRATLLPKLPWGQDDCDSAAFLELASPFLQRHIPLQATPEELCDAHPSSQSVSGLAQRMLNAIEMEASIYESEKKRTPPENDVIQSVENSSPSCNPLKNLICSVKSKSSSFQFEQIENQTSADNAQENFESLSDVSDTEIDWMLLNDEERRAKKLIWDDLMKNVMPEVYRRYRERRRREVDKGESPKSSKKKNKVVGLEPAATPAESVRTAFTLKSPALARRLNEDVLKSLFVSTSNKENESFKHNDLFPKPQSICSQETSVPASDSATDDTLDLLFT